MARFGDPIIRSPMPAACGGMAAPMRRAPASTLNGALVSQLVTAIAALIALVLVGWTAARILDSGLLGFVFADLVFLAGIALRGAISDSRSARRA